ncbi:MAG: hypothetical protein AAGF86_12700, partial [Pseudomonadota bacterium]
FYQSLKAAEKITPSQLVSHQREVATTFLQHVEAHVPFYRDRLAPIRRSDGTYDFERWHEIPMLSKHDVATKAEALSAPSVPEAHGRIVYAQSSASTGMPLRVPNTQLCGLAVACASWRHLENHQVDWSHDLAMIRAQATSPPRYGRPPVANESWGPDWLPLEDRGRRHHLSLTHNPKFQLKWLAELGPVYVNTVASNIVRLARAAAELGGEVPQIKGFLSVGERVDENVRHQARIHLKAEIIDVLATSECGTLANQCAVAGGYRVLSELAIVEVIGEDGLPVAPGGLGRVVATPLFNLAMPLIRYRFDDYVRLAPEASGGALPAPLIETVWGRRSELYTFKDGSFAPLALSSEEMAKHVGPSRWQVVQTAKATAEVRYMPSPGAPSPALNDAADYVRSVVAENVEVTCRPVPALGPGFGGKFPLFRTEVL